MTKTPKVLVGITAGLALLAGPTAVYAGQKAKAKKNSTAIAKKNKIKNKTECTAGASGLVAIPINACDVLDVAITDSLNGSLNDLLKNLLKGGLL